MPSGTERAIINLSNLLTKGRNDCITIISCYSKAGSAYFSTEPIQYIHLGLPRVPDSIIGKCQWYFKFFLALRRKIREQEAPFAIIGSIHAFNVFLPFLRSGAKTIGWEEVSYHAIPKYSRAIRAIMYRFLDKVVVVTDNDKENYRRLSNVVTIENSLSFKTDRYADTQKREILAVGRLVYQKGFDLLLEVFERILPELKQNNWRLNIYGEGELKEDLLQKIAEGQLQDYVKIHAVTKDILNVYLSHSIYVMTSRYEGLPFVLLEAQTCGLPIVSFDCPEGPSAVINDGENGYLIENSNIEQFAGKLAELMENEELRKKMSRQAKQDSGKYSEEVIFEKWNNLFNSL